MKWVFLASIAKDLSQQFSGLFQFVSDIGYEMDEVACLTMLLTTIDDASFFASDTPMFVAYPDLLAPVEPH